MKFDNDKIFYTETMARLLTRQGRYESAAEVYHHLLSQQPHRKDLRKALEEIVSLIPEGTENWEAASCLIDRWVTLMVRYNAFRQLKQRSISGAGDKRTGK